MVLILTIGECATMFAPIIALYDQPRPFIAMATMMTVASIMTWLLPTTEPDAKVGDLEERLMEGWTDANQFIYSPLAAAPTQSTNALARVNSSTEMLNFTIEKGINKDAASGVSFAIYAARNGFVPAVNYSTMVSEKGSLLRTMLGGDGGTGHSISLVRRYSYTENE